MIKGIVYSLAVILVNFCHLAEARMFTDAKGRQIEADLVAHSGDKIVIKRGGKKFSVPITAFSENDQTYIKGWIKENPDAVDMDYKFRFYADNKQSNGRQEDGAAINDKLKFKNNLYEMIVYNQGDTEVTDVTFKYEIYVADFVVMKGNRYARLASGADKVSKLEVIAGELKNQNIPVKGRVDFAREFSTEFYIDRDGSSTDETAEDKVIGVKIRVYKGKTMLDEFTDGEDSNKMSKVIWQDKAPGEQER